MTLRTWLILLMGACLAVAADAEPGAAKVRVAAVQMTVGPEGDVVAAMRPHVERAA